MVSKNAAEFLGTLLNRQLTASTLLRLSSAQRARFNAWLHERGVEVQDQRLSGEFTIAELVGDGSANTATAPTPALLSLAPTTSIMAGSTLEVGLDIQSVAELTAGINMLDLKADGQMTRMFTARELSYAQAKPYPGETITGLFAAKEAIRKCLGGPAWTPEEFRAIEVLPDEDGRPMFAGFSISISHSAGIAAAIACRSGVAPDRASGAESLKSASTNNTAFATVPARRIEGWLVIIILAMIALQLAILLLH